MVRGADGVAAPSSETPRTVPQAPDRGISVERRLLAYEPPARRLLVLAVASGFLAAVAALAAAVVMAAAVARVFLGGGTLEEVIPALAALAALAALRGAFVWGEEVLAQRGAGRLTNRLRRDLTARLFALGPAHLSRERSGELASVVVQGLEALETYLASFQPARLLAVAVPALVLLVVLALDPPTVLVLLFTGPILVLLLGYIGSRAKAITERRFVELRWMSALFLDLLQGLATLKAFGRSAEQAETIRDVSRRFGDTTMEVLRTAFQTALVLEWGAAVAMAVVAVEVSLRLMDGSIDFERALAVLIVTPEFFLPLRTLAIRYHTGAAGRAAADRVFELLDSSPSVDDATHVEARPTEAERAEPIDIAAVPAIVSAPKMAFDRVSFAYPGREPLLTGLSLDIPAGGFTVLAGRTGAGKSTVVGLLLRFLDPDRGAIIIDGHRLDGIDPSAWRASVGLVPQLPHLFHGTVGDNLRLGRPGATESDLLRAVRAAGAEAFIRALPGGFDAAIGVGGLRLSGGERQRLTIARALLREAPLLVLDEPTAHLDEHSESAVIDSLRKLAGEVTIVAVSHRTRVAEAADHVVVLSGGSVAEQGAPAELLAGDGPFRRLVGSDDPSTGTNR